MNSVGPKSAFFLATLFLTAIMAMPAALAANKPQAFTGRVTDAMCGENHMMGGEAAECVRVCVRKGSKYALVVGDKVYALETSDQAALDKLDKLSDRQAKVTGQADGNSIAVSSVAEAK